MPALSLVPRRGHGAFRAFAHPRYYPPLCERLDQVMRDRHREGRLQPVRMRRRKASAGPRRARTSGNPRAPPRRARRRSTAPRRGSRSSARRGMARSGSNDRRRARSLMPDFLLDLAPHRLLDRLARLEEAGERRIHARREARLPAEQAALAVDREHDHHRIDARKDLDRAGRRRCGSTPPRFSCSGPPQRPQKRFARMPVEIGARLRERREIGRIERALDRERAKVDRLDRLGKRRRPTRPWPAKRGPSATMPSRIRLSRSRPSARASCGRKARARAPRR